MNDLNVPDSEEITKLQKQVKSLTEQLQKADELQTEILELRPQHWLATEELRIANERCKHLEAEVQRLNQENQELQKKQVTQEQIVTQPEQPDYEAVRDRVLNKLKLGKQSTGGKAIAEFIRELQKLPMPHSPGKTEKLPKVTQVQPVTWEVRADDFLKEVAGNG